MKRQQRTVPPDRKERGMDAQQLKYVEVIEAYQDVIETFLKAKDILSNLISRGVVISGGVKDMINEGRVTKTKACSALLGELKSGRQHPGWFKAFIESLEEQKYTMLVHLLKGNTLTHKDYWRYTELMALIDLKAPEIEKEVNLDVEFMSLCMAEELLNARSREEIECEKTNSGNMNAVRLLLTLIHRYNINWFAKFMSVLIKCKHRPLAEEIAGRDYIADLTSDERQSSSQDDAESIHMDYSCEDDGGVLGRLGAVRLTQESFKEYQSGGKKKKEVKRNNNAGGVLQSSRRHLMENAVAFDSQKNAYRQSTSSEKNSSGSHKREWNRPTSGARATSCAASNTPVAPSEKRKYVLTKRNGNMKRCQGCKIPFNDCDEAVLKVFESHLFYNTNSKAQEDTPRNYYYHPDKSCVCKTNPKFSERFVIPDSKLTMSPEFEQLMKTRRFLRQ